MAEGRRQAGHINGYADELEAAANSCDEPLKELPNPGPEQTWLRNLKRAVQCLRRAVRQEDDEAALEQAEESLRLLDRILARDPIRLHGLILHLVEAMPLPKLIFSLRTVRTPSSDASSFPAQLVSGTEALEALHLRLIHLVEEHSAWQNLDNSLRVALDSYYQMLAVERRRVFELSMVAAGAGLGFDDGDVLTEFAQRLREDWPDVADKFKELKERVTLDRSLDRLTPYAEDIQEAVDMGEYANLLDAFEPFVRLAFRGFIDADKKLLNFAEDLVRIGGPLRKILEVMER
jgi:hypothetical protein